MARFYGAIGYIEQEEVRPGVWVDKVVERMHSGDLIRNTHRSESSETLNDDINIDNEISIIADPFAYENFRHMKYVVLMNAKWEISSVQVQRPRLILSIRGLYNG